MESRSVGCKALNTTSPQREFIVLSFNLDWKNRNKKTGGQVTTGLETF